jgi:glycosyltransferase involved in cell wall biosynthesis
VAHELADRLPTILDGPVVELAPAQGKGVMRGHLWEQCVLPRAFRRSGAEVLISLCNFGPTTVSPQVVLLHDVAPFVMPEMFSGRYTAVARTIQRRLARQARIATVSEQSRRDIAAVLGLDADRVDVVPPAVGTTFRQADAGTDGANCLFVGGHDPRKNLPFLQQVWPLVHRRTGAILDAVARSRSSTLRAPDATEMPGVVWHRDISDTDLARLYRDAKMVVSPSRYEGFGLPLLEGMASGTPFLSTAVGAAPELAVAPDEQLLPLEVEVWQKRLISLLQRDLGDLRRASHAKASHWTWERSAERLAATVDAASRSG